MATKKKSRRKLFGAAIATALVLVIVPALMLSQQPTGQVAANSPVNSQPMGSQQAANSQIISQHQVPQQPVTPRDAKCRSILMDFNTCMQFMDLICFSNADCGPFTCQGNKCVP